MHRKLQSWQTAVRLREFCIIGDILRTKPRRVLYKSTKESANCPSNQEESERCAMSAAAEGKSEGERGRPGAAGVSGGAEIGRRSDDVGTVVTDPDLLLKMPRVWGHGFGRVTQILKRHRKSPWIKF